MIRGEENLLIKHNNNNNNNNNNNTRRTVSEMASVWKTAWSGAK